MKSKCNYEEIQNVIKYQFKDKALLTSALTHSSAIMDNPELSSYERLEYLGDAVLDLLVTKVLFISYPKKSEGWMTKVRASVVSETPLAQIARELGLGQHLIMGKGTENAGGRELSSILADSVEALIAAIYVDDGIEAAQRFIMPYIDNKLIESVKEGKYFDYKTRLQELMQRHGNIQIKYELVEENGPPHERVFTSVVTIDGKERGQGTGKSKKISQQEAAKQALKVLDHE